MRAMLLVALMPLFTGIGAQTRSDSVVQRSDTVRSTQVVERVEQQRRVDLGALGDVLDRLRDHPMMPRLPRTSDIKRGSLTIEAGQTVTGPVAVFEGNLTVLGRLAGDAVALGGDIVVGTGGEVTGDAVAVEGEVRREGGTIGGDARHLRGVLSDEGAERIGDSDDRSAGAEVGLAISWMGVLLLIGIGILVFAQPYLEGVVDTLETKFWRSFFVGIAGALAAIPVLVLMLVALAVTVIGILLIPFAIVAYVLAIAGLLTL
ncbi:MAG TPA: hypothetical protein VJ717_19975, partial [Gemmatimonadaceae bacterium]|nr:hypothetical protein [Gemmatimonadaceae bacterium]